MATVERSTRRPLFRWVALGSTAAFLLASGYNQAWGGLINPGPGGGNTDATDATDATDDLDTDAGDTDTDVDLDTGQDADLGDDDDDDDDDDDGLSSGEIAAIAVGGLAVGAGAWYLLGGRKRNSDDGEEQSAAKAEKAQKVTALRLVPGSKSVPAGGRNVLDLQARGKDGKWFSVTADQAASIEVKGDSLGLRRLDGSRNTFALPISAPAAVDGKRVTLVGRYQGLTARTTVQLQVGSELLSSR